MWGLSGLKTLNLSHNQLTNVIDQNFEGKKLRSKLCLIQCLVNTCSFQYISIECLFVVSGLYSLTHLVLDDNLIRSMVSAAFRHIPQLETLSLKMNLIEGMDNVTDI